MNQWKKIIYNETPKTVRCCQGIVTDKGDFLEVKGTYKSFLINKHNIISIQTSEREQDDRHTR